LKDTFKQVSAQNRQTLKELERLIDRKEQELNRLRFINIQIEMNELAELDE
jgi:hypothetical protein